MLTDMYVYIYIYIYNLVWIIMARLVYQYILRNYPLARMGYPTWSASRFRLSSRVCQNNVFFVTGLHMRDVAAIPPAFYSEFRSASF